MEARPVDDCLAYAAVVNMKVLKTCPFVVRTTPAVTKGAPLVPVGLLALYSHVHLKILEYLEPTWVQKKGRGEEGGRMGEGERGY